MSTTHLSRPIALRIVLTMLAALIGNTIIAFATSALDDTSTTVGLDLGEYLPATAVGFLIGALGWTMLARFAPRTLRVVVPVVLVLSWIPDLLLLNDGASIVNVVGLMLMHLVVTAAVVAAFRRTIMTTAPAR
ncbi:DUF6069 family protein [Amycolatopsis japonica]|uniref:DUF6069 family protein n=1 Tax=Amycolatopsis japonica TaxID=208439 RepID=UPI0036722ECE